MAMTKADAKAKFIAAIEAAFTISDTVVLGKFADAISTYVDEIQQNATVTASGVDPQGGTVSSTGTVA